MKKLLAATTMAAILGMAGLTAGSTPAQAHDRIDIAIGLPGLFGGYGHGGGYGYGYGYPRYYAPVVYAPPVYAYPVYEYAQPVRYYRPAPRPYPVSYAPAYYYGR